jgi:hypothetical protein
MRRSTAAIYAFQTLLVGANQTDESRIVFLVGTLASKVPTADSQDCLCREPYYGLRTHLRDMLVSQIAIVFTSPIEPSE